MPSRCVNLFVVLDFSHCTCAILANKEVVSRVHTYTPWTLKTTVVDVAEEVSILVYDVDTVVEKVSRQDIRLTVCGDAQWME